MKILHLIIFGALASIIYLFLNSSASFAIPLKQFFILGSLAFVSLTLKIKSLYWISALIAVGLIINIPSISQKVLDPMFVIALGFDAVAFWQGDIFGN